MPLKYLIPVIVFILLSISFHSSAKWYQHTFDTMGTRAHIEFWLDEESAKASHAEKLISDIMAEMDRLDKSMSPYIKSSELSLLNRDAGNREIVVSPELISLLVTAHDISVMSEGAFDITYASIGYQYDYREKIRPAQSVITNALPSINYQAITLDKKNNTVKFANSAIKIDLGGIAKGYAIKRCISILRSAGINYALMSAGGDTALLGDRNGRPWLVGIKHPRAEDKNAVHIPLSNEAISTSGDYERYFIEDGKRYHHIINPKTGDSARKVVSVSVIGKDATVVDALSTTLFVKGLKEGMAIINKLPEYEAIIIDNEQRLHFSKGLQQ
ncbi:FAD:protein FMN transferase [Colwellia sp. 12G3]|uniref:FAD:protein FMN transferase n=1 Tax=Colwellia sp. 12G3 TaxID=2058299 RepID=UPI000C322169|nr:FAD:protein FMN transferase [Colwellia sp. 12G3]PKI13814.1 thiamine biosynthesis protein ApbE [Colwellia sp. 12G3]